MKKICRTCDHWQVTGSGEYGHAMYPGSWGTERRHKNMRCKCQIYVISGNYDPFTWSCFTCGKWEQAGDIIDECEFCGALLYEYNRPITPGSTIEYEENGTVRFWFGGEEEKEECLHSGIHYHGLDPFTCGMCQGIGQDLRRYRCDACHGLGKGVRTMVKLRTVEFYDYLDKMNADSDEKANANAILVGSLAAYASDEVWNWTMQRIKKELEEKREKEEKTNAKKEIRAMKTTNGLQILDVYDEIYRNTERFEYPTECSSYTICPNCKKTVVLLTGYQSVVECDNCGFCWIIS